VLAKVAWACGMLGHQSPQLFAAGGLAPALFTTIDGHGNWLAATATTHTIAKMAWAFAKLDHRASSSSSTSSSLLLFAAIDQRGDYLATTHGQAHEVTSDARSCRAGAVCRI
jgi:hypothetical protein